MLITAKTDNYGTDFDHRRLACRRNITSMNHLHNRARYPKYLGFERQLPISVAAAMTLRGAIALATTLVVTRSLCDTCRTTSPTRKSRPTSWNRLLNRVHRLILLARATWMLTGMSLIGFCISRYSLIIRAAHLPQRASWTPISQIELGLTGPL